VLELPRNAIAFDFFNPTDGQESLGLMEQPITVGANGFLRSNYPNLLD
jgi:hypothetical protein